MVAKVGTRIEPDVLAPFGLGEQGSKLVQSTSFSFAPHSIQPLPNVGWSSLGRDCRVWTIVHAALQRCVS